MNKMYTYSMATIPEAEIVRLVTVTRQHFTRDGILGNTNTRKHDVDQFLGTIADGIRGKENYNAVLERLQDNGLIEMADRMRAMQTYYPDQTFGQLRKSRKRRRPRKPTKRRRARR